MSDDETLGRLGFDLLVTDIASNMSRAAAAYLRNGLRSFHEQPPNMMTTGERAFVVGCLGVGIELVIKAVLMRENPCIVWDCQMATLTLLSAKNDLARARLPRGALEPLRNGSAKLREMGEVVSALRALVPSTKQLGAFLDSGKDARNRAIHCILPDEDGHHASRMAYAALKLLQLLRDADPPRFGGYYELTTEDDTFVRNFDADRAERVRKKVEAAKQNRKRSDTGGEAPHANLSATDRWDSMPLDCKVCDQTAVVRGQTVLFSLKDRTLGFEASSFECPGCGLKLPDVGEMDIAGFDTVYDRSDDFDEWYTDRYHT